MKLRRCLLLAAVGALLNLGISGCGNSEEFVFTQGAVVNPNVPPTANLDNYLSVGNAPLTIPAARGVLANDEVMLTIKPGQHGMLLAHITHATVDARSAGEGQPRLLIFSPHPLSVAA